MTDPARTSPPATASAAAASSTTAAPVAPKPAAKAVKPRGIRQTMSDLHTWAGLLVGWILYAMFLTGTVAYFRDEMSHWMRPELPAAAAQAQDAAALAQRLVDSTTQTLAPHAQQLSIRLPTARDPSASVYWRAPAPAGAAAGANARGRFETAILDPSTGQTINARATKGGDFFYIFHFNFYYMHAFWGRWIAGFCAMFMLVAIISGVITHKKIFADFFTFRWGKGQRSWLDAHNALSVFGLPFHFMITWSGLVTLMLMYMPWGMNEAFQTPQERQQLTAEMGMQAPTARASAEAAPLASIEAMVRQAQAHWGSEAIGRITIDHVGDANAQVLISPSEQSRISTSPRWMLFQGSTGAVLQTKDHVGAAAETRGVLYGLHIGRFADTVVRWLYFLVSLAGCAMVATGLVLWTVKRRTKLPDPSQPYFGFRAVERLNIAAIAGLSVAMTGFLWLNRLLPLGLSQRAEWEVHGFFILWLGTLAWAMVRPAKRAWVELLWLAAALLALLPLLSALTTPRNLWASALAHDWVWVGFELSLLAMAALHAGLALRTHRHQGPAGRKPAKKAAPAAPAQAQAQAQTQASPNTPERSA